MIIYFPALLYSWKSINALLMSLIVKYQWYMLQKKYLFSCENKLMTVVLLPSQQPWLLFHSVIALTYVFIAAIWDFRNPLSALFSDFLQEKIASTLFK